MTTRLILTMSALASFVAAPALAGSLHAPFAFVTSTTTPYCLITNVDSKPIEVTVSATSVSGLFPTQAGNNCPVPPDTLNPGATCFASYNDGVDLACRFTAKGKARASVQVVDGSNNVLTAIPATAK